MGYEFSKMNPLLKVKREFHKYKQLVFKNFKAYSVSIFALDPMEVYRYNFNQPSQYLMSPSKQAYVNQLHRLA